MKSDDSIALGFDYPQNTQLHIQEVLSDQWLPTYPEADNDIGYNLMAFHKILGIVLER
jgi:aminoglycoside N3'-acetyltransferase